MTTNIKRNDGTNSGINNVFKNRKKHNLDRPLKLQESN